MQDKQYLRQSTENTRDGRDDLTDIRGSQEALIAEFTKNGIHIGNPRAIRCPFHDDKSPSACIERHSSGAYRFVCRAASCQTCEDVFGVRAKFANRPTGDVMKDWRKEQRAAKGRPGEDAKDGGDKSFFATRERLNRPGQDDRHTGKSATADHGRDAHKPVIVPIDPPLNENDKRKTGNWVKFNGNETRVFDSHEAWFQFYAKLPGTTRIVDHSPGYADLETGEMTWLKLRIEPGFDGKGKTFVTAHVHSDGKVYGCWPDGIARPLYRNEAARKVKQLEDILIVEGEKAADALNELQMAAVSTPLGADAHGAKVHTVDWSAVRIAKATLWPDHDPVTTIPARNSKPEFQGRAGHEFMRHVATYLEEEYGCETSWVDPEQLGLGDKQDAADFIEVNRSSPEQLAQMITDATGSVPRGSDAVASESPAEVESEPAVETTAMDAGSDEWKPMPLDCLPKSLREYVAIEARRKCVDPSVIAITLLATAGAAIGNSRALSLKSDDTDWIVPPLLWGAIVDDSGGGKSPAFDAGLRFAHAHIRRLDAEHDEAMSRWRDAKAAGDEESEVPKRVRFDVGDITAEALTIKLAENPRGLIRCADELTSFFTGMNQYKRGGSDEQFYLTLWGARRFVSDRVRGDDPSRREIVIPRAFCAVIGGIQWGKLRKHLDESAQDSGLAARFLFAAPPEQRWKMVNEQLPDSVSRPADAMFGRLFDLRPELGGDPRIVRLMPAATSIFGDFAENTVGDAIDATSHAGERAALKKLRDYCGRLALITHMLACAAGEPGADPERIDERSMASAVRLSHWFAGEARRVYAKLEQKKSESQLDADVMYVKRRGGSITARDFQQGKNTPTKPVNKADAERRLDAIVAAGRAVKHAKTYHLTAA